MPARPIPVSIVALLFWLVASLSWADVNYREPARSYARVKAGKRSYWVERQLLLEDPELMKLALNRLDDNFSRAESLYPGHSRSTLRRAERYLMFGPRSSQGGRNNGLEYFRTDQPLHWKHLDPRWSNCVVCYSAENYRSLSDLWALKCIVHELAHCYYLENYPEQQPELLAAWQHARDTGLYCNMRDEDGRNITQAYALVNQLEYFAELSTMMFSRCDYGPQSREEFSRYDPLGYVVIRKLWKI